MSVKSSMRPFVNAGWMLHGRLASEFGVFDLFHKKVISR